MKPHISYGLEQMECQAVPSGDDRGGHDVEQRFLDGSLAFVFGGVQIYVGKVCVVDVHVVGG